MIVLYFNHRGIARVPGHFLGIILIYFTDRSAVLLHGSHRDAEGAPGGLVHQHHQQRQSAHAARIAQQQADEGREARRHQLDGHPRRLGGLGLLGGPEAAGEAGEALEVEHAGSPSGMW